MNRKIFIISTILLLMAAGLFYWIRPGARHTSLVENSALNGDSLARRYCTLCHSFPEPVLLDKGTWLTKVLPNMGWRLGIRKEGDDPFANTDKYEVAFLKERKIFPDSPLIGPKDWNKILAYYQSNAPDAPREEDSSFVFNEEIKDFSVQAVFLGQKLVPRTSMLKFDPLRSLLYIGDADSTLSVLRSNLRLLASWKVDSPPVDMGYTGSGDPEVLCIGSISPSDKLQGRLYVPAKARVSSDSFADFRGLARPVQFEQIDLNGDGKKDMVLCQFGNYVGRLSWFDASDPHSEHILLDQPGAVRIAIRDMNQDGKPDIIALMAQAREELLIFWNQGNGSFKEQVIREFPPVYGVNYFELDDFNGDGHPDILMTNGDNWDLSPIRKFYHGIRILMNNGHNEFEEKYFFPLYGANKAMACDFDGDGDLDIAAIAFYNDPEKPQQSFVYMENKGNMKFTVSTTDAAANGKWLTMDIGDFNRDGKTDIFLGSYFHTVGEFAKLARQGVETFPQALLLWNNTGK